MKYKYFFAALLLTLMSCFFIVTLVLAGANTAQVGFSGDMTVVGEETEDGAYKISVMGKSFTVDTSRIQEEIHSSYAYSLIPKGAKLVEEIYVFLEENIEKFIKELR